MLFRSPPAMAEPTSNVDANGPGVPGAAGGADSSDPATVDPSGAEPSGNAPGQPDNQGAATQPDETSGDPNAGNGGSAGLGQKDPSPAGAGNQPDSQPDALANGGAAAGTQPDPNAGAAEPIVQAPIGVPAAGDPAGDITAPGSATNTPATTTPATNTPVTSNTPDEAWPVVRTTKEAPVVAKATELARFGDGLLVGDLSKNGGRNTEMIDGVMPGSRAFAQLHNGNYFIGQVKQVAETTITLRVETGEVTLATGDIAQLTRLGSADYEQLQKATKGFVRLTNNNRRIGGILSRIADDHVVLEFRSNRVMLPKSAIGEIVSGDRDESKVRLDTTSEEDSWVRQMVRRQIGTGQGAETEAGGSQLQSSVPGNARPPSSAKPAPSGSSSSAAARIGPPR